jgi:hypothetical protein
MLPDTGIDDVKTQRNAEYAKHLNDPVLSSLKMEGIRSLLCSCVLLFHTGTYLHEQSVRKERKVSAIYEQEIDKSKNKTIRGGRP